MTLRKALEAGYRKGRTALQCGYVSRRSDAMEAEVLTAGGNCKGEKYVLISNPNSTYYCIRQYLISPEV